MKKLTFIVAISLLGCNNGSSIADRPSSGGATSTASTGGTTVTANGGTTVPSNGGTTVTANGGTTVPSNGGTTVTPNGGSTVPSNGGTAGAAKGGATIASTGGSGTGGTSGSGGSGGATGSDAGPDATPADARKLDGGGTGGAPGTGGATGTGGGTGTGGSTTACVPAATGGPTGMNTGRDCISCHGSGQSPNMIAAGTVYSSMTGGTAVSGATVTITGSNGTKVTMVTGSSGNFYTSSAISFPATVVVSKCPDTATMPTTITSGGCNSCHGSTMRIHLP